MISKLSIAVMILGAIGSAGAIYAVMADLLGQYPTIEVFEIALGMMVVILAALAIAFIVVIITRAIRDGLDTSEW